MAEKSDTTNLGNGSQFERFSHLLDSGEYSDLDVFVGETKERIKAHKLILMVASPVLKEKIINKKEIEIPQIEPDVFKRLLKFIYTGETCLDWKYGIPLLNAAKYFQLPDLENICGNIVDDALNKENVLTILQQSVTYRERNLVAEAVKILCTYAYEIVETNEFLELTEECLEEIVDKDELAVRDEMQIFEACVRWSEAECLRQGAPVTPKYCRSILEKLIPHIRFPLMDPGDFSLNVASRNILTTEELVSILLNFNIPASKRSLAPKGIFKSNPRQYSNNALERKFMDQKQQVITEVSLPFKVGLYSQVKLVWPEARRHILASFDKSTIVLYHACTTNFAVNAVTDQTFLNCANFNLTRMTWFNPSFLWLMYRSSWAMHSTQTNILAITITREGFEDMLRNSTHITTSGPNETGVCVSLQWEPDYDPNGERLVRRAIQIGVKNKILDSLLNEWIVKIQDVTDFVSQQREIVMNDQLDMLQVPREKVYRLLDHSLVSKIWLDEFNV